MVISKAGERSSLNGGEIAALVIFLIIFLVLLAGLVHYLYKRKYKRMSESKSVSSSDNSLKQPSSGNVSLSNLKILKRNVVTPQPGRHDNNGNETQTGSNASLTKTPMGIFLSPDPENKGSWSNEKEDVELTNLPEDKNHDNALSSASSIEHLERGSKKKRVSKTEFCICGRFGEFKCPKCGRRSYCSSICMKNDLAAHNALCSGKYWALLQEMFRKKMNFKYVHHAH